MAITKEDIIDLYKPENLLKLPLEIQTGLCLYSFRKMLERMFDIKLDLPDSFDLLTQKECAAYLNVRSSDVIYLHHFGLTKPMRYRQDCGPVPVYLRHEVNKALSNRFAKNDPTLLI